MFLVDDVLLSPIKGMLWVFREIHDAAQQELAGEGAAITAALSELYLKLETGQISEAEFDAGEQVLLNRLDRLQAADEAGREAERKPVSGRPRPRSRKKSPSAAKPATLL